MNRIESESRPIYTRNVFSRCVKYSKMRNCGEKPWAPDSPEHRFTIPSLMSNVAVFQSGYDPEPDIISFSECLGKAFDLHIKLSRSYSKTLKIKDYTYMLRLSVKKIVDEEMVCTRDNKYLIPDSPFQRSIFFPKYESDKGKLEQIFDDVNNELLHFKKPFTHGEMQTILKGANPELFAILKQSSAHYFRCKITVKLPAELDFNKAMTLLAEHIIEKFNESYHYVKSLQISSYNQENNNNIALVEVRARMTW